jgi:hypothetical protein
MFGFFVWFGVNCGALSPACALGAGGHGWRLFFDFMWSNSRLRLAFPQEAFITMAYKAQAKT